MKDLINKLNQLAYIETHPNCWVVTHCLEGCSKGGTTGEYFNGNCSCGKPLVIDKVLKQAPK